jgi:YVTN family beta-propeller protein
VPFDRGSDLATLFAHLDESPPAAREQNARLPAAVDAVLARAMAKEPDERYATCAELVTASREALGLGRPPSARGRKRTLLAGAGAVLAGLLAVAAILLATRGGPGAEPRLGALVRIDPATNQVAATYPIAPHPSAVAVSGGQVWVGDFQEGALYRFRPQDGEVSRIAPNGPPRELAALGDRLYVASDGNSLGAGSVTAYNIAGTPEDSVALIACVLASGEGVLWAGGCPSFQRLSSDGGKLRVLRTATLPLPPVRTGETERTTFQGLAAGEGAVWALGDMVDRSLWRLDPRSGRAERTIELRFMPGRVAAGAGAVWVTAPLDDTVARIDPATGEVTATIATGRGVSDVATGEGSVWVASSLAGTVERIDPATNRVVETIRVGGRPRRLAVGAGAVWVTGDAA